MLAKRLAETVGASRSDAEYYAQIRTKTPIKALLYQRRWLSNDVCPFSHSDRCDCFGLSDQSAPGIAAGVEYGAVCWEHAVGQPVLAQVLPDVLDRVEFR